MKKIIVTESKHFKHIELRVKDDRELLRKLDVAIKKGERVIYMKRDLTLPNYKLWTIITTCFAL